MGRHSRALVRSAKLRSGAAAVAAQGSQSIGSLVLQVLAARGLGAEGLGKFGLLYGTLVVATAIATGFVGDSMTVLDRSRPPIRAALQGWLGLIATSGSHCWPSRSAGALDSSTLPTALAFGAATLVFLFEDAVRRLLMANLKILAHRRGRSVQPAGRARRAGRRARHLADRTLRRTHRRAAAGDRGGHRHRACARKMVGCTASR